MADLFYITPGAPLGAVCLSFAGRLHLLKTSPCVKSFVYNHEDGKFFCQIVFTDGHITTAIYTDAEMRGKIELESSMLKKHPELFENLGLIRVVKYAMNRLEARERLIMFEVKLINCENGTLEN